jgi:hypothetical protein
MAWKYDYLSGELVWVQSTTDIIFDGQIDFGNELQGDLELSCGSRDNENSIIDNGSRVLESGD